MTSPHLNARSAGFAVIVLLAFSGCGKKENPPPAPTPEPPAAESTGQLKPAPQQNINLTGPAQPEQWMTEAQTYQSAGDYDKAAQYLLAIQKNQQAMTEQQAAAYWKQMTSFQSDLASRLASGDPSAKAAAERLRASTMH